VHDEGCPAEAQAQGRQGGKAPQCSLERFSKLRSCGPSHRGLRPARGPRPTRPGPGSPITAVPLKGSQTSAQCDGGAPVGRPGPARPRRAGHHRRLGGRMRGRTAPGARTRWSGCGQPQCRGPSHPSANGRALSGRPGPSPTGPRTGPPAGTPQWYKGRRSRGRSRGGRVAGRRHRRGPGIGLAGGAVAGRCCVVLRHLLLAVCQLLPQALVVR
jgi:hypothetical protein